MTTSYESILCSVRPNRKILSEENQRHYFCFDSNGGSSVPSQEIEDGNQVVKPTDPVRECYEFAGWYVDEALTVPYDFATPVTSDMTLYAKWVDDCRLYS